MQKRPPQCKTSSSITLIELQHAAEGWILDGRIRQLSARTLEARTDLVQKLLWYLRHREAPACGTRELRGFLAYLTGGHEEPGGRWGNPRMTKSVKPSTVETYFVNLQTLFGFLVQEGDLPDSPMATLKPPVYREDQIQPFTQDEVRRLLDASRKTRHPRRDEAIVWLLLDTGMRASELVGLNLEHVEMQARRCTVTGKGNKQRSVYFGATAARAVWAYLREGVREPESPLLTADAGTKPGERLTRSGLLQLIERLGGLARIEGVRCSPHTFRHYFAIEFLRAGGNIFTLKELLGHTSLTMVNRYLKLAQADLENQHRQFSPGDRLRKPKKG
jgi:site-specific recombinase XerD